MSTRGGPGATSVRVAARPSLALNPPFVLLEDRLSADGGARLFRAPLEAIACRTPGEIAPALARIEAAAAAGRHGAGFLAYEAFSAFEPRVPSAPLTAEDPPLLWFGVFEAAEAVTAAEADAVFAALAPSAPVRACTPLHDRATHVAKVARVLELIAAGELYQANLTFPIRFDYAGDPVALYAALRARQPVAHAALIATGAHWIVSVSPELFVEVRDGVAVTRPMKGTAARGATAAADGEAARRLRADPKQRAENLMIVDLLRNDLSRVCRPGTVRTPELFTVESFPSFHALTSTVRGELAPDVGAAGVLQALFPCGSVVGAPKIAAARALAALEPEPRSVYTGAIGAVSPGGRLAFSVAIRTAVIDGRGRGRYGVGGGVVADSDPALEYEEALLKARVLTELARDFGLIETLAWRPGEGFVRLHAHLDRLAGSAAALGFVFDRADADARLSALAATLQAGGSAPRRLRLELARNGRLEIDSPPLAPEPDRTLRVGFSEETIDPGDPFLRHKTTLRDAYERAFAAAAARGLDEALLLNRRGEIADAARASVFLEADGRLLTPRLEDGALAGVLRAELIAQGRANAVSLRPADLAQGRLWLGSSLRGLRPAVLVDSPRR